MPWIDLSNITAGLEGKEGITADTFPFAALYISLINFPFRRDIFRGFAFLKPRGGLGACPVLLLSAAAFAPYRVGILKGWAAPC